MLYLHILLLYCIIGRVTSVDGGRGAKWQGSRVTGWSRALQPCFCSGAHTISYNCTALGRPLSSALPASRYSANQEGSSQSSRTIPVARLGAIAKGLHTIPFLPWVPMVDDHLPSQFIGRHTAAPEAVCALSSIGASAEPAVAAPAVFFQFRRCAMPGWGRVVVTVLSLDKFETGRFVIVIRARK